jgi:translation initiation factor IF-1
MSDVRIEAKAVVREVLDERRCRASLPNGKIIFAYVRKDDPAPAPALCEGGELTVLMSLCDFSEGRIVTDLP